MKDCGHNSVVIKPLVPDDVGACLTPIEAIRHHNSGLSRPYPPRRNIIAGRYWKVAVGAQRRLTLPIRLKGTTLRFQITGNVENVGSLVWNDFSLFSCRAASQTKSS